MGIASSRNSEDSTPPPAADDSDSGSDSNEEVIAQTVYARSPFRRGQLVLVPAKAFGDEYAAEKPGTLLGTLTCIKSVERDESGEERRIWEVQYETGPWETDEGFFDAEFQDLRGVATSSVDEKIQVAIASGLIPLFMFWKDIPGNEMPRIVRACMTRIRERAGGQFKVFLVDSSAAPAPPRGWGRGWGSDPRHKIAHIKDYVSFHLMKTYGGVWLDASIV